MALDLKGRQVEAFRDALLSAFPVKRDLEALAEIELGETLEQIVESGPLRDMAFRLVLWARSKSRLDELLAGALRQNATNETLLALSYELSMSSDKAPSAELEALVMPTVAFENAAQWRARMAYAERCVCRIEWLDGNLWRGLGTGSLVAADIVLTNHHVAAKLAGHTARAQFDYVVDASGAEYRGPAIDLAPDALAGSDTEHLDFALLRLAERIGDQVDSGGGRRGWLEPSARPVVTGEPIFLLQHPRADRLKLGVGVVTDVQTSPPRVLYTANTEHGSSGSPCFTLGWELVALHHAGGTDANRGIPLTAIVEELRASGKYTVLGEGPAPHPPAHDAIPEAAVLVKTPMSPTAPRVLLPPTKWGSLVDWHWRHITSPGSPVSHTIAFVFIAIMLLMAGAALKLTEARPIYDGRHVSYLNAVNWALASMTVIPAFVYMFLEALHTADRDLLAPAGRAVWAEERRRLARWWCLFGGLAFVAFLAGWAVNSGLPLLGWMDKPKAVDWSVGYLDGDPVMRTANCAFSLVAYSVMAIFGMFCFSYLLFVISLAQALRDVPLTRDPARRAAARLLLTRVFLATLALLTVCYLVRIWHGFIHDRTAPPFKSLLPFMLERGEYLDLRLINFPSVIAVVAALVITASGVLLAMALEKHVGEWPSHYVSKRLCIGLAFTSVLSVVFYWLGAVVSALILASLLVRAVIRITQHRPVWWLTSLFAAIAAMALVFAGAYLGTVGRLTIIVGVLVFTVLQIFRWERRYFRLAAATLGTFTAWHTLPRIRFGFDLKERIGSAWGEVVSEPPSTLVSAVLLGITALLLGLDFRTHQPPRSTPPTSPTPPRNVRATLRRISPDAVIIALTLGIPTLGLFVPAIGLHPSTVTIVYALFFLTRLFLWLEPPGALPRPMLHVWTRGLPYLRALTWVAVSFMIVIWLLTTATDRAAPTWMCELLGVRLSEPHRGLRCIEQGKDGCIAYRRRLSSVPDVPLDLDEGTMRVVEVTAPVPSAYQAVKVVLWGDVEVRGGDETSDQHDILVELKTHYGACETPDVPSADWICLAKSTGKGRRQFKLEGLERANSKGPISFRLTAKRCRRGGQEATCSFGKLYILVRGW